eukprot:TRINITY_DN48460_c0_g1_i1.p1 TRINITY_DN48460_c0_g1~~TRINITY_DN48460_c0_g1_i1.p1  ORF type:complete len:217 (-),score=44.84 TRINITY_DN48460_c0_g1_i1:70-678(-)
MAGTFTKTSGAVKAAAVLGGACIVVFALLGAAKGMIALEYLAPDLLPEALFNAPYAGLAGYAFFLFVFLRIRDEADVESEVNPSILMKRRAPIFIRTEAIPAVVNIFAYFVVFVDGSTLVCLVWLFRLPSMWKIFQGEAYTIQVAYRPPAASPSAAAAASSIDVEAVEAKVVAKDARALSEEGGTREPPVVVVHATVVGTVA